MGKVEYALKTLLYPVPVLLVSSGTEDGRSSIMPPDGPERSARTRQWRKYPYGPPALPAE